MGAPGSGAGSTFLSSQCSLSVDLVAKLGGISGAVGNYGSSSAPALPSRGSALCVFSLRKGSAKLVRITGTYFVCRYYPQLPQKLLLVLLTGREKTVSGQARNFARLHWRQYIYYICYMETLYIFHYICWRHYS